jgi:hypothetical protein
MRCGFKISKGFETGSDRFNLTTAAPGSVFSASCNPLGSRFGSFTIREIPFNGYDLPEVMPNLPRPSGSGDKFRANGDGFLRFAEGEACNVPLGFRIPAEPSQERAERFIPCEFSAHSNLRRLETVSAVGAAVRGAGLGFVAGMVESELLGETVAVVEVSAEFRAVGVILPPAPVSPAELPTLPAPKLPGEYELSPFRGDTSPEIPTAKGVSELPSEVPAIPCAETDSEPVENIEVHAHVCPCGKGYAHRRSLLRHARTCPQGTAEL